MIMDERKTYAGALRALLEWLERSYSADSHLGEYRMSDCTAALRKMLEDAGHVEKTVVDPSGKDRPV